MSHAEAMKIIDQAYGLAEPNDTLITITEQGLVKAIASLLTSYADEKVEEAIKIAQNLKIRAVLDAHGIPDEIVDARAEYHNESIDVVIKELRKLKSGGK